MNAGDFYSSEKSVVIRKAGKLRIEFTDEHGKKTALKESVSVQEDEVIDAAVMSCRELQTFYERETQAAKSDGLLLSLHLKATMMKVSDPIMFGHAVRVYYKAVFDKHAAVFDKLGVEPNNGIGDVYARIQELPAAQREEIEKDIQAIYKAQPLLAMVDSDKGITNLHVPSNVIIDASIPAAIRTSGQMWGPDGKSRDTSYMIPDRCYAGIYQEVMDDCKKNGAFNVPTMGAVSNVGLMAQKAEEYGSHDKTFEIPCKTAGSCCGFRRPDATRASSGAGRHLAHVPDERPAIRDWVKLAVTRARLTGSAAIFWLDPNRARPESDRKVQGYLKDHDTAGWISAFSLGRGMAHDAAASSAGQDTISISGNVLRDYLTDLFPILELGTSAKMLSIVPLLAGGGLYETGRRLRAEARATVPAKKAIFDGILSANFSRWRYRSKTKQDAPAMRAGWLSRRRWIERTASFSKKQVSITQSRRT
jgi:isocitrate dehydrogenase